jgi:two-component system sensor histidine kinase YesM
MKFLLQPIVENSILHAFEEDKEHQMLYIKAVHRDSFLEIEIADNGKGFSTEESITKTRLSGIGIHNIEERIKLMYGDKFSMSIQSEIGKGTITTLLLPYII